MIFPETSQLLLFMSAGFTLNITPGPDMLYIIARSTAEGRRSGVASALGVAAGTLFHITLVAAGLASLLATKPSALVALRLGGAAYLGYLGIRVLLAQSESSTTIVRKAGDWAAFRQGAMTNVMNPKVALFFLAFLPQFVDASRGSAVAQVIVLGLIFDVVGTIVNVVVAMSASRLSQSLRQSTRTRNWLKRLCGAALIGLGVRLAISTKS